tara:strand:+ start:2329 stop:2493 length:165 start_codon:yes stop_codon:yes gene_type:complete
MQKLWEKNHEQYVRNQINAPSNINYESKKWIGSLLTTAIKGQQAPPGVTYASIF